MARIEKTVFISYRRKDISWALAVYQYLTSQKYDVFFDYTSIPSGDFEQIIVSNIKARAHFVLILTPTALDRCGEPGDWLRREIETAIDEKRNIIPLFFDGFSFGLPTIHEKLTGKLSSVSRYNGLDIPSGYFVEAMGRLRIRYLNVPLNAVIHPISTEVRKAIKEEQVAADKALHEQKKDIQELVKPMEAKDERQKHSLGIKISAFFSQTWGIVANRTTNWIDKNNSRSYVFGLGVLLFVALGMYGVNSLIRKLGGGEVQSPMQMREPSLEFTLTATRTTPASTSTVPAFTSTATRVIPTETFFPTPTLIFTVSSKDGMILLYIPAGEFNMGYEAGYDDEKPVHTVYLDSFWIDKTEVTNVMYRLCVQDGKCDSPVDTGGDYYFSSEYDNSPVIYVSWYDAQTYCSWANRRLPTEAEWEKAARGGLDGQMYPWGNESPVCDLGVRNGAQSGCNLGPAPVGSFMANDYGIYDMVGNVDEWVSDWYDKNYYVVSLLTNPLGPNSGEERVARGGSWTNYDDTVSDRDHIRPAGTNGDLGFRCAMSASQ